MPRLLGLVLLVVLPPAFGERPAHAGTEKHDTFPDKPRRVADIALAAPPELAADLLIRCSELRSPSVPQRVEWLLRAFNLAGSAIFPMPLTAPPGRTMATDSDTGTSIMAFGLGLDTLSLHSRIVRDMLPLDRAKAMDLFRSIPPPSVPSRTCRDALVPSAAPYFDVVRAVYSAGFIPKERKNEEDFHVLSAAIGGISAPVDLDSALRLVLLPSDNSQVERLANLYSDRLANVSGDDRSFGAKNNLLVHDIQLTAAKLSAKGMSAFTLVAALRTYLMRQLAGTRCAEGIDGPGVSPAVERDIEFFNTEVRNSAGAAAAQIEPIRLNDIHPHFSPDVLAIRPYWTTPSARRLLMGLKQLSFGTEEKGAAARTPGADGRTPSLGLTQRMSPHWNANVREYLGELEGWRKDHTESEQDYFHMASIINISLAELIPDGELRRQSVRNQIALLQHSAMAKDNPPEWVFQAMRLIRLSASSDKDSWIREEIRTTADPALSSYAEVDALKGVR